MAWGVSPSIKAKEEEKVKSRPDVIVSERRANAARSILVCHAVKKVSIESCASRRGVFRPLKRKDEKLRADRM